MVALLWLHIIIQKRLKFRHLNDCSKFLIANFLVVSLRSVRNFEAKWILVSKRMKSHFVNDANFCSILSRHVNAIERSTSWRPVSRNLLFQRCCHFWNGNNNQMIHNWAISSNSSNHSAVKIYESWLDVIGNIQFFKFQKMLRRNIRQKSSIFCVLFEEDVFSWKIFPAYSTNLVIADS